MKNVIVNNVSDVVIDSTKCKTNGKPDFENQ